LGRTQLGSECVGGLAAAPVAQTLQAVAAEKILVVVAAEPGRVDARPVGQLNARALATAVPRPAHRPNHVETSSTASRYTTPVETTGTTSRNGKMSAVVAATARTETTAPSQIGGRAFRTSSDEGGRAIGLSVLRKSAAPHTSAMTTQTRKACICRLSRIAWAGFGQTSATAYRFVEVRELP